MQCQFCSVNEDLAHATHAAGCPDGEEEVAIVQSGHREDEWPDWVTGHGDCPHDYASFFEDRRGNWYVTVPK